MHEEGDDELRRYRSTSPISMSMRASLISCSFIHWWQTMQLRIAGVWEDKRIEGELSLCPGNTEQSSGIELRPKRHSKRPVGLT